MHFAAAAHGHHVHHVLGVVIVALQSSIVPVLVVPLLPPSLLYGIMGWKLSAKLYCCVVSNSRRVIISMLSSAFLSTTTTDTRMVFYTGNLFTIAD